MKHSTAVHQMPGFLQACGQKAGMRQRVAVPCIEDVGTKSDGLDDVWFVLVFGRQKGDLTKRAVAPRSVAGRLDIFKYGERCVVPTGRNRSIMSRV
jgi:hypothetical protein